MRRSDSIFDSRSEREVFRRLESHWSRKLRLFPQLPFAKLVRIEPWDELTTGERSTYFATNVDYTFCDLSERPLFSIEFDGIGAGFSRRTRFVAPRSHCLFESSFTTPGVGARRRARCGC